MLSLLCDIITSMHRVSMPLTGPNQAMHRVNRPLTGPNQVRSKRLGPRRTLDTINCISTLLTYLLTYLLTTVQSTVPYIGTTQLSCKPGTTAPSHSTGQKPFGPTSCGTYREVH